MRRKKRSHNTEEPNMTPMIDVVFQMIIFFVCTVEMERQSLLDSIKLATSPHGPAVEQINPMTVKVDVDKDGKIYIARVPMSFPVFVQVMKKTVAQSGNQVPVVIRGDSFTRHKDIKAVMDACKGAGLWKVKFAAVKEEA
jgi:biopolymer transport protein ExbD